MAELADALDLGSSGQPCGFDSHYPYQSEQDYTTCSDRSLILPLLSSKPDPLRWAPAWGRPVGGCFCPRKNIGFDRSFHVVAKFAL